MELIKELQKQEKAFSTEDYRMLKAVKAGSSLMSEFWKESADLIEKYRDSGDERAAQGVVSCRILIDRLMKQLENDR